MEGVPCTAKDVMDNMEEVAKKLCMYHEMEIKTNQREENIWNKFNFLIKLIDKNSFQGWGITYHQIREEVEEMKEIFEGKKKILPTAYSHNDFNIYNLILNKNNENKNVISIIDHEYSGYNFISYDIANFFNEWMGIEFDVSCYPSFSIQKNFVEFYLNYYNHFSSFSIKPHFSPVYFSPELYGEINMFSMVSSNNLFSFFLSKFFYYFIQNRSTLDNLGRNPI